MSRWRDERGVTVQIGAVLLLAIVFAALALYQVNAVPAENHAIESEHNGQVQNEMQELRNAIANAGTTGDSTAVSVTLGTQYPARTFSTNPTDPTGTLETTGTANVSINATFAGDRSEYDGDPDNLTGTHETTTVAYTPEYNEYRSAPTTRIEHGFAFNDFGNAAVPLTDQPLIADGTIRLVVLEGNLSKSSSGALSVDSRPLSGPSDEVPIEPRSEGENITITIPTTAPDVWNESIGSTFESGESTARVVNYESGRLRIELADRGEYRLRLARVGIDGDGERSDEYDVTSAGATGGGAYDVSWNSSHDKARQCGDEEQCDYRVYSGETATFGADASAESAALDFAYDSSDPTVTVFDERDREVDFEANGSGYVDLFVSSGGSSDTITVLVENDDLPPTIDRFDVTDENHANHARFSVDWEATAGDAGITEGRLELIDSTGAVVDTWESTYSEASSVSETGIGLENKHGAGEEYDIRLTVTDSNGHGRSETVTRTG